jgi:diaminohydroxyphosphoribosylaminopyrimidine deaminase / 5-amino-6-(5-phosphoribosylamino)uracil reductase
MTVAFAAPGSTAATDERFMREALAAAAGVEGCTGDNPWVGCVIVREGVLVARGGTQNPPGPHAEIVAIEAAEAAGADLHACDLYVTLEPCSFHGRTPPCAQRIAEIRPRRVIVGVRDPHPRVNGAGLRLLRDAGLDVQEGVLADDVRRMLQAWFARWAQAQQ